MTFDLDAAVMTDVRAKARELKRNAVFKGYEREDIEQDLVLDLLERARRYTPSLGDKTMFVRALLRNKAADMVRKRSSVNAAMRRNERSLDCPAASDENGDSLTLADITPDRAAPMAVDVLFDIDRDDKLAELPQEYRGAAHRLHSHTQKEVADEMGLARVTFIRRYLQPIRHALEPIVL